jgi:hypothetical protein
MSGLRKRNHCDDSDYEDYEDDEDVKRRISIRNPWDEEDSEGDWAWVEQNLPELAGMVDALESRLETEMEYPYVPSDDDDEYSSLQGAEDLCFKGDCYKDISVKDTPVKNIGWDCIKPWDMGATRCERANSCQKVDGG